MILQQDLIEWLKENENVNENSDGGTGLLLAPLDSVQHKDPEKTEENEEKDFNEDENTEIISENPDITEAPEEIEVITENNEPEEEIITEISEPQEIENPVVNPVEEISEPDEYVNNENDEYEEYEEYEYENFESTWPETAVKYDLSLDEPPIELWTKINESPSYSNDYAETDSLQGDAYIPRHEHGKNFTQRLQETLRGRKQRAEILRREEAERKNNPRLSKAVIMCSAMLIEIALACIVLFSLNRYSAVKKFENENQPSEQKNQERQIEIILPKLNESEQLKEGDVKSKDPEPVIIKQPETFESLLRAGTRAYNLKDYDGAIINFHKAMKMRDYDIRSYIGLAGAYKAKGMYFDSKRVIDDARKKIGNNPTLDVQLKILERE